MKRFFLLFLKYSRLSNQCVLIKHAIYFSIFTALLPFAAQAKNTSIKGYIKPNNGQYVQPHMRTTPDKNYWNNFSSQGNVSPNTGKEGTVTFEQYQQKKFLQKTK